MATRFTDKWRRLYLGAMMSPNGKRGYRPNAVQTPVLDDFEQGARLQLICGGERSGKSMTAAAVGGLDMGPRTDRMKHERRRRYWIIGPDYRQARPEFQYIFDALTSLGLLEDSSMPLGDTQPWSMITKWNTIIETRSSSDVMKLASFTVDGVIIAEAGQQQEEVLRRALGRTSETRGWILLVGTLEDALPWYENLLRQWASDNPEGGKSYSLPMWSNVDIFPLGKQDPEIKRLIDALPADYVARRYGAQAVKHANLVVPEFEFATHVRSLKPEPEIPVELAIDPGKNAYAVLFCQHVGAFTKILDCIYTRGEIAQVVIPRCMEHPLWPLLDLEHGEHVIDVAGTQEAANKSQVTLWREIAGINLRGKYWHERDTINAIRFRLRLDPILAQPLLLFSDRMKTGIAPDGTATEMLSEFDLWRWPKATPTGDERARPIDNNNHALKALGYKLLYRYDIQRDRASRGSKQYGVQQASWMPGTRVR